MSLLPDPGTLRVIATRIGAHADAARARATDLDAELAALSWHGVAAGMFDKLAGSVISALRTSAHDLDRAAQALRDHAAAVEAVLDDMRREGVDLVHASHDIVSLLRDGADPTTLLAHPGVLLRDGAHLVRDAPRLLRDEVTLYGDVVDAGAHDIKDGARALGSLVGIG